MNKEEFRLICADAYAYGEIKKYKSQLEEKIKSIDLQELENFSVMWGEPHHSRKDLFISFKQFLKQKLLEE